MFLAVNFEPSKLRGWAAAAVAVVFVSLVPIMVLFALRARGRLASVEMRERSERELVYFICAASYAAGALTLYALGSPWAVWGLVALHVPYALCLAALNRRWKVSIHTTGFAGIWAAGLVLFGMAGMPLALLVVIGGWGRWAAGAHTLGELTAGTLVGFVLTGGGLQIVRVLMGG